jgi:YD repeat-containing protein
MATTVIRDSSGRVIGHTHTSSNGNSATFINGKKVSDTTGNWTKTYDSRGKMTSLTNNRTGKTNKY